MYQWILMRKLSLSLWEWNNSESQFSINFISIIMHSCESIKLIRLLLLMMKITASWLLRRQKLMTDIDWKNLKQLIILILSVSTMSTWMKIISIWYTSMFMSYWSRFRIQSRKFFYSFKIAVICKKICRQYHKSCVIVLNDHLDTWRLKLYTLRIESISWTF